MKQTETKPNNNGNKMRDSDYSIAAASGIIFTALIALIAVTFGIDVVQVMFVCTMLGVAINCYGIYLIRAEKNMRAAEQAVA